MLAGPMGRCRSGVLIRAKSATYSPAAEGSRGRAEPGRWSSCAICFCSRRLSRAWLRLSRCRPRRSPGSSSWGAASPWLGRKVSCGKADIYVDHDLPSEGGAGDTVADPQPGHDEPAAAGGAPVRLQPRVRTYQRRRQRARRRLLCRQPRRSRALARPQGPDRGLRQLRGARRRQIPIPPPSAAAPTWTVVSPRPWPSRPPSPPTPVPAKMPPKLTRDGHRRGARVAGTQGRRPGAAEGALGLALHRSARSDDGSGRSDRPGDQERRRARPSIAASRS